MLRIKLDSYLNFIKSKKNVAKPLIKLLIVFAFLKSLTFLSPLLVNEIIDSATEYGEFEYSMNLAQALTGVFAMGFPAAYAYFVITLKRINVKSIFHLHFSILSSILCLVSLLIPSLLSNIYFGSLIIGAAIANQVFLSSVLKLNNQNKIAVILDSSVFIILSVLVILDYLNIITFTLNLFFGANLMLLFFTIIYHLKNIKGFEDININVVKEMYTYGMFIVICSPLLVLITASSRLYIDYFLSLEDVSLYSVFIRITSVIFILSRVFGIMLYRKMFAETHKKLDNYYSIILVIYLIIGAIIFLFLPNILFGRYEVFTNYYIQNSSLFLICLFQVIFWINTSLLEPIIQRENKVLQFILLLVIVFFLMISCLFLINQQGKLSLNFIVIVNTFAIFFLFCGQILIIKRQKIFYKKTFLMHMFTGFLFIITLLYENITHW